MRIVAADIGGTHARFALAELEPGRIPVLGEMRKYRTRDHEGLASAWAAFGREVGDLPGDAALAVAAPIEGETLTFINSPWRIARATLGAELGIDKLTLVNDFGAVAHAVSVTSPDALASITGPDTALPEEGVTTVLGPGTGLGVALLRRHRGAVAVIETEASHIGFAPLDAEEQGLRDALVARYGRASVERVVSGPGLADIYRHFGGGEEATTDSAALWQRAIDGGDPVAARALALFVRCLGSVAGDIALAHGAMGVAITGGLANRVADLLRGADFAARFLDKGRYRERMARIPVRLLTADEPGLIGAAVAFQRQWCG
jgi:glucokinase